MKSLRQCGALLILSLAIGSTLPAPPVLAQAAAADGQPSNEEGLSTRWAMAYGLVGLGIVLGLINVCRPGKRKGDSPKPA